VDYLTCAGEIRAWVLRLTLTVNGWKRSRDHARPRVHRAADAALARVRLPGGCRLRSCVAEACSASWRSAEFPSKWRKRFSGFHGGSENQTVVQDLGDGTPSGHSAPGIRLSLGLASIPFS